MYRRVVLTSPTQTSNNPSILYHARGAVLLAQYRRGSAGYDATIGDAQAYIAVVFDDVIRLKANASVAANRSFEFILDIAENQPTGESVEELTTTGIDIEVYNADSVLVCRNVVKNPDNSAPTQTDGQGEMTSLPGEEPGEMASEPIDGPGEMTNEPIDATDARV